MVELKDIQPLKDENKKILGFLGKGTYGFVYSRFLPNHGDVAIKRIQLFDVVESKKVDRESMTGNLDHPNVLKLLFIEQDDDWMYLVLEMCEGTLQQYFNSLKAGYYVEEDQKYRGPDPPHDVKALHQLASGLNYIHNQQFVHRDLKSDNILISSSGDLKISDFGFCKQTNGSGSFSIGIMSQQKINYVTSAPELLEGKAERANQMSDIFSLGCLFFTFLTRGSHLFQETDDQNAHIIPTNILEGKYWLEERLAVEKRFAESIISGMVKKDPNDRSKLVNVLKELENHLHPSAINH